MYDLPPPVSPLVYYCCYCFFFFVFVFFSSVSSSRCFLLLFLSAFLSLLLKIFSVFSHHCVHAHPPETFALGAATGTPLCRISARAIGCCGMRMPTVSWPVFESNELKKSDFFWLNEFEFFESIFSCLSVSQSLQICCKRQVDERRGKRERRGGRECVYVRVK